LAGGGLCDEIFYTKFHAQKQFHFRRLSRTKKDLTSWRHRESLSRALKSYYVLDFVLTNVRAVQQKMKRFEIKA
jgi:hypothetical protein